MTLDEKETTWEGADCSLSLIRAVRKLWIWPVVGISLMVISGVDGSLEAHMLTTTNTEIQIHINTQRHRSRQLQTHLNTRTHRHTKKHIGLQTVMQILVKKWRIIAKFIRENPRFFRTIIQLGSLGPRGGEFLDCMIPIFFIATKTRSPLVWNS